MWTELSPDHIVLMVSHPNGTSRYYAQEEKEKREMTRRFVTWLRKTFPEVATEYRPTVDGYYARYDGKRVFAAYGLTKKQFMLIKLSWRYDERKINIDGSNYMGSSNYIQGTACIPSWAMVPSSEYMDRQADKVDRALDRANAEINPLADV
jgi:hypothetical protein